MIPMLPHLVAVNVLLVASIGASGGELATPRLEGRVTDLARVLSAEQRHRLTEELAADSPPEIALLTVPTLSGESIEAFSLRVFNTWDLGKQGQDKGLLVTFALQEGKVRIELGRGLESVLPREVVDSVVHTDMTPAFRNGDYAGGLEKGIRHLVREVTRLPGSLDCDVDVRIHQVERQATMTAEIAKELGMGQDTAGRLGLTRLQATAVGAKPRPGTRDAGCSELVGGEGSLVLTYELSDPRAKKLIPGEVIRLYYWALPGMPLYGVPTTARWAFPPN